MLLRHTPKEIKERSALTINPAKTCQPIGAMYAALGIHSCLPHSHGSQGAAVVGIAPLGSCDCGAGNYGCPGPRRGPMGWQVLAGLMVKAECSLISLGVCLSNMALSSVFHSGD